MNLNYDEFRMMKYVVYDNKTRHTEPKLITFKRFLINEQGVVYDKKIDMILEPQVCSDRLAVITGINEHGTPQGFSVHRMLASTFMDKVKIYDDSFRKVYHLDKNLFNNSLNNLIWISGENMSLFTKTGTPVKLYSDDGTYTLKFISKREAVDTLRKAGMITNVNKITQAMKDNTPVFTLSNGSNVWCEKMTEEEIESWKIETIELHNSPPYRKIWLKNLTIE